MLYPTETLDLLPPVEQIDAHLKHQKSIFRPRADGFLKEKAERKVREMACSSRFSDFRVWQGQKDLNPRHAVLEGGYNDLTIYVMAKLCRIYAAFSCITIDDSERLQVVCGRNKQQINNTQTTDLIKQSLFEL